MVLESKLKKTIRSLEDNESSLPADLKLYTPSCLYNHRLVDRIEHKEDVYCISDKVCIYRKFKRDVRSHCLISGNNERVFREYFDNIHKKKTSAIMIYTGDSK
jgi:hypothetical protein